MNIVRRFLERTRQRGSSDLTVTLLLTAAGAAMVGMTVPSLFRSSDTASRTFDRQVQILERGAGTPGASTGTVPPAFDVGDPGQIGGNMGQRTGQNLTATPNAITQSQGAITQSQAAPLAKGK